MDPTKEQHQILCKTRKRAAKTLAMIRQAFGEESVSSIQKVDAQRMKKARQVKGNVNGMLITFL
jgi:hypothetical protein